MVFKTFHNKNINLEKLKKLYRILLFSNFNWNTTLESWWSSFNKVSSILRKRWSWIFLPNWDSHSSSILILKTSWFFNSKLILSQFDSLNNFNSVSWNSIVTTHFVIHLIKSTLNWLGSIFLEHILITNVCMILKIDTKILSLNFLLSKYFLDFKNFAVSLFNLVLSSHNLPELGLSEGSVWSNNFDDCDCWFGLSFSCFDSSVN